MQVLIRKALILDRQSPFHREIKDILIDNGTILQIGEALQTEVEHLEIHRLNLAVSPGWIDIKSHFCDPGEEHKETVQTGLDAAAYGGFTQVAVLPSTHPVVDSKADINYLLKQAEDHAVGLHPIAAITQGMKGECISEMYDLFQAGARLFSDDNHPVSAQILHRALLYGKQFGARVMAFSRDASLAGEGIVNEGIASVETGLKADSEVAEWIEIKRNIDLLRYTEGRLHLTGISSAHSVDLIRSAKAEGLDITCDVHLMNLLFTEEKVLRFDADYKVLPVLRTENDRKALWKGLKDGVIDVIASDHRPCDTEEKEIEFEYAQFGSLQLQTMAAALAKYGEMETEELCEILSRRAERVLGLEPRKIEENAMADLTLFSIDNNYSFKTNDLLSFCTNSVFLGEEFSLKPEGIIRNGNVMLREEA